MAFAHPGLTAKGRMQYASTEVEAETMIKIIFYDVLNWNLL